MNFETVTVNGLAVATVPGRVYVLACNPNDNSVSLIDTTTNTVAQRVPVGLGPVAVTWNPSNNRFYTANLIGDSVTAVEVTRPNGVLQVRLIGTEQVFDEPMDVAIGADGLVYVAQGGRSALTRVNATTLATVDAFFLTDDFLATNLLTDPFLGIPATNTTGGPPRALRTPRRLVMDGTLVHVLSLKGDTGVDLDGVPVGSPPNPGFKYSMLTWDTATQAPAVADAHWNTFGSANEAMVRGVDGNLYVVGSLARNDVRGNAALSALPRGFVESHVWTVPSGLTPAAAVDRDLNDDGAGNTVAANLSAATPAGVALLASGNNVTKVFVSSFGTDRIIELNLAGGSLPTAGRTVITVPAPASNAFGAVMSGPRDLEIATTTAGARLYCLNDLDCSVSVFDPNVTGSPQLARVALANRLSASQQVGRRFLYDARVSGSGKVSCASCHIDGKTDSLAWHLGTALPVGAPNVAGADLPFFMDGTTLVSWLYDGVTSPMLPGSAPGSHAFPTDKGLMVTQTLQGLVDHPVNEETQYLFTGAPYHWRGDRATFDAFNEAFVNLLGAPPLTAATSGPDAKGLTDADMRLYRIHVESIMYPPNPEQQRNREFSGSIIGDINNLQGSAAKRGLAIFVGKRLDGPSVPGQDFAGRSCVHCHALPSGSDTRICITDPFGGAGPQPLESAQLRGLVQREGLLDFSHFGIGATPRVGEAGLVHSGEAAGLNPPATINSFINVLLGPLFTGVPDEAADLVRFVREMDWGIAPIIGRVATITPTTVGTPAQIVDMEAQAILAHCDVVARLRTSTGLQGYYFDVVASTAGARSYRSEAGTLVPATTLIAKGRNPDSAVIFEAVPVGSGRRIASGTGNGSWATLTGAAPGIPTLLAMRPATPWRDVASITRNWTVGTGPLDFSWSAATPTPIHPAALRIFQNTLATTFGVTSGHHEPPRRFRVTGTNIRPGARLRLAFSISGGAGPGGTAFQTIELPIFPNREAGATLVWETAAEATPIAAFALLCGGPFAPDVARVFLGAVPENVPNALAPATWNSFHVRVVNADGTSSPFGVWQPLTVQNN